MDLFSKNSSRIHIIKVNYSGGIRVSTIEKVPKTWSSFFSSHASGTFYYFLCLFLSFLHAYTDYPCLTIIYKCISTTKLRSKSTAEPVHWFPARSNCFLHLPDPISLQISSWRTCQVIQGHKKSRPEMKSSVSPRSP